MDSTTILEITWGGVVERLGIDDGLSEGKNIFTRESWPKNWGGQIIDYRAKVIRVERIAGHGLLHLRYKMDEQPNRAYFEGKQDIRWGDWEITWNVKSGLGHAKWIDEDPSYDDKGIKGRVAVEYWKNPSELTDRNREMRSVGARPNQQKLRKELLRWDKSCAITGNSQSAALEVAHIIGASTLNLDVKSNAILLRADLHRLFDADLIRLARKNGKAIFSCSKGVAASYSEQINGVALSGIIFKRIDSALAVRERFDLRKAKSLRRS